MKGPYKLKRNEVQRVVTRTSPGYYKLYRVSGGSVSYVGRSDSDVGARLLQHADEGRYVDFEFDYATSRKDAFEHECELWHRHHPPDNDRHPDRPVGTNWKCPRCSIF